MCSTARFRTGAGFSLGMRAGFDPDASRANKAMGSTAIVEGTQSGVRSVGGPEGRFSLSRIKDSESTLTCNG